MKEKEVSGVDNNVPQCQHRRLLERIPDREGHKTDAMKCCECGALVRRPAHKAPTS